MTHLSGRNDHNSVLQANPSRPNRALAAAGWVGAGQRRAWPWYSLPVLAYGMLVALDVLLLSPAYTPAGLYHPLLLAGAFVVARSFTDRAELAAAVCSRRVSRR